jgi:hypothetical protein
MRMRISHVAAGRLAAACANASSLCIGFRPASRPAAALAARRPSLADAPEAPFFDMSLLNVMPRRLLSLEMHASAHVAWPLRARAWPAAVNMHTLVLDVPCEWCVGRVAWDGMEAGAVSMRVCRA